MSWQDIALECSYVVALGNLAMLVVSFRPGRDNNDGDVGGPRPHGAFLAQDEPTKADHRAPGPWTLTHS
jgi:hypothetical protein